MRIFSLILFSYMLMYLFSCTPSDPESDVQEKARTVLMKGRLVEWAFNNNRMDTVLNDFWQSDTATFILNGRKIDGYEKIMERFSRAENSRNRTKIDIIEDKVVMLSPTSAVHIAAFEQTVADSINQVSHFKGAWTTLYRHLEGDWVVISVHESFYPSD
jgi:hypothetical protein